MIGSVVMMGVAGCGKSTVGAVVAQAERLPLVEGDDYHSAASRDKMSRGIPLADADRVGWLATLAGELAAHPQGIVLTCSALRRAYREQLRAATPALRFVFLDLTREQALARVTARASSHFFSATLVDSQFETLESPVGEPLVLRVDATASLAELQARISAWLHATETP